MVARYYEEGWGGVEKNLEVAIAWYRKAAEQGYDVAQYNLGNCLFNGLGCVENRAEAFAWYKKAAEKNVAEAQNMVARYYEQGWSGVTKNIVKAFEWYKKAAEQGFAMAQCNVAICLEQGYGCSADKEEALQWYKKAAEQGYKTAQEALDRIKNSSSYTSSQVAAQSSGCLLPILVTFAIIIAIAAL